METINFIWAGISLIVTFLLIKWWVVTYNKFIYWITKAKRKFADIEVIMQQRVDMIHALAQVVKKYDIHEYKTLKDIIEARSRWSKDTEINEKVKAAQELENNFFKLQAVFERYPKLKAEILHKNLMGRGNLSRIESKLKNFRLGYNKAAQEYNERVKRIPRNIVAKVHGFKELEYLQFEKQESYKPKEIFEE